MYIWSKLIQKLQYEIYFWKITIHWNYLNIPNYMALQRVAWRLGKINYYTCVFRSCAQNYLSTNERRHTRKRKIIGQTQLWKYSMSIIKENRRSCVRVYREGSENSMWRLFRASHRLGKAMLINSLCMFNGFSFWKIALSQQFNFKLYACFIQFF